MCARKRTAGKKAAGAKIRTKPAGGEARGPGTKPQNAGAPAGSPAHSRRAAAAQAKQKTVASPPVGNKAATHRRKKRRSTGHKSRHNSGRPRKNGQPGTWRGVPGAEKPLRTGKIRVRSFACPEGPCEPGPPKNASLFWLAQSFLLRIARSAEQKGAPPPFIPCKLFEKSLTKNFHVGRVCHSSAKSPAISSAAAPTAPSTATAHPMQPPRPYPMGGRRHGRPHGRGGGGGGGPPGPRWPQRGPHGVNPRIPPGGPGGGPPGPLPIGPLPRMPPGPPRGPLIPPGLGILFPPFRIPDSFPYHTAKNMLCQPLRSPPFQKICIAFISC